MQLSYYESVRKMLRIKKQTLEKKYLIFNNYINIIKLLKAQKQNEELKMDNMESTEEKDLKQESISVQKTKDAESEKKPFSFYWIILIVVCSLIFIFNLIFFWGLRTILFYLITIGVVVAPTVVLALIASHLPSKCYEPTKKIYHVFKFESKLYEFVGVRKYKEKIPELGKALTNFDKSKIAKPDDPEYMLMFLKENCKGSLTHVVSLLWGIVSVIPAVFIFPMPYILTMWLPAMLLNTTLHFISLSVLRYIRPRLLKLYQKLLAKEERTKF